MPTDIVGSKIKTFPSEQTQVSTRGYGENGYAGPSSLTPAQARAVSRTYASLATDTPDLKLPGVKDWQTRTVSAKPFKPANTMHNPNASPAKIPATTQRGSIHAQMVKQSVKPAKRGNAKR
jgi:hypothetical protein